MDSRTVTELGYEHVMAHRKLALLRGPLGVMPDKLPTQQDQRELSLAQLEERVAWRRYQEAQDLMIKKYINLCLNRAMDEMTN